MLKGRTELYDIDIDDGTTTYKDMEGKFFWLYNGKFGGGGMVLSPYSVINDGYFEMTHLVCGFKDSIEFFDDIKDGGR